MTRQEYFNKGTVIMEPNKHGRNSYFDGGLLSCLLLSLGAFLVNLFSLGLLYPLTVKWFYGWKINHTVIEGQRLHFNGTAMQLFGNWIKWACLTIVTLGIYSFWVRFKLLDWQAKHTTRG